MVQVVPVLKSAVYFGSRISESVAGPRHRCAGDAVGLPAPRPGPGRLRRDQSVGPLPW